ncbi:ABC transporter ATP-binding protein [Streptobacillus moniliformis]|uniref:ABC transporter ATP-binding protein n=1 Tax=Streptobacillus moniliformis TaxID=34105 RepID=UPI0007E31AD5|nr:ABC transporter ATP-binding protein [Streptobacillus moniliformis]QXW65901.1 ABC transporter ATP-binding protein [Streptobacillus moniliformis]
MIKIENLSLLYSDKIKVLNDISMNISDGKCILLTGESGSGKSSIINSINGLAFEYENAQINGNVNIDGHEIKELELYKISLLISSVFQNPKTHFFNVNTTLELLFYLENIGLNREEMEVRLKNMLEIFPIEYLLGRNIFELSGGEKQILCLASCYISGCKTIVLDEPSSNLDEKYINILKGMLEILKNKGITLILAEHRIYYLMDIVDRVFIIKNGNIERKFTKDDFLLLPNSKLIEWGIRNTHKPTLSVAKINGGSDLTIKKLNFNFNDNSILKIEDISFNLGNIYGIIGKNGSGKSTFLRIMTGLEEKEKSHILFKNKPINRKERLKNSALVMQDVNHQLFTDSVEEEMKLGIKNLSNDKIDEILSDLRIISLKDRHPMSLSGGQKQRVAIASILCKNSKFIFLDEPTSGMDYMNMMRISKLVKKMRTENNIIFIVSHDIEFLNETTDHVICIDDFKTNKY